jgi:hypothetical protein
MTTPPYAMAGLTDWSLCVSNRGAFDMVGNVPE